MRELGFHESHAEGAPVCRWISGDLILDLMPTDASILGFGNRWYQPALENAQGTQISDYEIRVITAPYFLATRLEAFRGRGRSDFRRSHDLEDIVTVVDGRPETVEEVRHAPADLQKYLSDEFRVTIESRFSGSSPRPPVARCCQPATHWSGGEPYATILDRELAAEKIKR
jgi:hypothetical protein